MSIDDKTMSKSKTAPRDVLSTLRKLNPDATAADLKELFFDEVKKDPEHFAPLILKDLFARFRRETGYRGECLSDLLAWLHKPSN